MPRDSAELHEAEGYAMHVKHGLLNKFFGPEDERFKELCGVLEKMKTTRTRSLRQALDLYYSTGGRLDIVRLSKEKLSMRCCFINLGIVHRANDREHRVSCDNSVGDSVASQILSSFTLEARLKVDTPPVERQMTLEEIFNPRVGDSLTRPRRVWIWGSAGVGKTTLCKKIVFDYINEGLWKDQFNCILWVPLRDLKLIRSNPKSIGELIHTQYFRPGEPGLAFSPENLEKTLKLREGRTLFILDGLDEVYCEFEEGSSMGKILDELLSQPNVIVTSRPHRTTDRTKSFDLELETIGFFREQIEEYLQGQKMPESTLNDIRDFIRRNPLVQSLARIPVQLDAICYAWDSDLLRHGHFTVSSLYWALVGRLCEKDIPHLSKKFLNERSMHPDELKGMPVQYLSDLLLDEFNLLERLAFDGLCQGVIEFDMERIYKIKPDRLDMLDGTLLRMSFLRFSGDAVDLRDRTYHFLHLTYQEFFAAKYFVGHWTASVKSESFVNNWSNEFLAKEKYNIRYDMFWRFVVGLLRISRPDLLDKFFEALCGEPLDLVGPAHQRLVIHCLAEVFERKALSQYFRSKIDALEARYTEWIKFESGSHSTTMLLQETEFPDRILQSLLKGAEISQPHLFQALQQRPSVSREVLMLIVELIRGEKLESNTSAFSILGMHLTEDPGQTLSNIIQNGNKEVKMAAAGGFAWAQKLQTPAVDILTGMLQDSDVQAAAADALRYHKRLPLLAIKRLVQLLQAEEPNVRRSAARALDLKWHTSVQESLVETIVPLLQCETPALRITAAQIIQSRADLPKSAVDRLIALLEDENIAVQRVALKALLYQTELSVPAFEALIQLLQHQNDHIRCAAKKFLAGYKRNLPQPAIELLMSLRKGQNVQAKRAADTILKNQADIPGSALEVPIPEVHGKDRKIQLAGTRALCNQTNSSKGRIDRLMRLLETGRPEATSSAAARLRNYVDLPVERLTNLLRRWEFRGHKDVLFALSGRSDLPKETLDALVVLLGTAMDTDVEEKVMAILLAQTELLDRNSERWWMQLVEHQDPLILACAAAAWSRVANLTTPMMESLIKYLDHENFDIRADCVRALGTLAELPMPTVKKLALVLNDEVPKVREVALIALARQSKLSNGILKSMLPLLQDKEHNIVGIARAALSSRIELGSLIISLDYLNLQLILKMLIVESLNHYLVVSVQGGELVIDNGRGRCVEKLDRAEEFRETWIRARKETGMPSLT